MIMEGWLPHSDRLTDDWAYPVVEAVEATVAGEAVAI